MKSLAKPARVARSASGTGRITLFIFVIFLLSGLIIYRLFNLTQILHSSFVVSAQNQYNNPSALLAGRGNIYISDLSSGGKKIIATNKSSFYIYSNNTTIGSPADIAKQIDSILKKGIENLEPLLSQSGKTYQVIAQNLTEEQANQIKTLKIKGLTVASEIERFYPLGSMAAPVLGFVGFNGNQRTGQYGIESYFDDALSGVQKTQDFLGDNIYSKIVNFLKFWDKNKNQGQSAGDNSANQDGSDVVLTLDENIQSMVELKLDSILQKWKAEAGSIIVENPNTGAILAMASSPSFDPNNYSDYKLENFINPNTQEVFEPGSSFKPVTMSAAVDSGALTPDSVYTDSGAAQFGAYTIRNFDNQAHGVQTMRQVLEHSLNTGAVFAENATGDDTFLNYVVAFGFGQKTGIDSGGEVSGNISNLYSGRKVNFATAAFGQGIAATTLQMINAYSAIANGGKLMQPYLVKKIIHPDGTEVETKPKIMGAPISEKTSAQLKSMLVDVVEKGFDKARIAGYDVAGKTGTAQIPDPKGGYLENNQFIHNFVGFAPAYSPQFVVLIKMDKPKGIKFAADSLSPVFGDIARFLIRYFNIPPTK